MIAEWIHVVEILFLADITGYALCRRFHACVQRSRSSIPQRWPVVLSMEHLHSRRTRYRIASPELLPLDDLLPHVICSPPVFAGGGEHEADQHDDA